MESRRASGPMWLELDCWSLCAQRQRGHHEPPPPPFDRIQCVYTHSWSAAASSCCHGRMGARGGRRRRPGRPCGSSDRPPRHFGPQQPRPRRVPTPNRLERPARKSIDARCDASNGVVGCGVDSAAWWSLASLPLLPFGVMAVAPEHMTRSEWARSTTPRFVLGGWPDRLGAAERGARVIRASPKAHETHARPSCTWNAHGRGPRTGGKIVTAAPASSHLAAAGRPANTVRSSNAQPLLEFFLVLVLGGPELCFTSTWDARGSWVGPLENDRPTDLLTKNTWCLPSRPHHRSWSAAA